MYTLRFKKSLSKNYSKALEIAVEFGAVISGDEVILEVPDYELLYAYEKLLPLFYLISKWRGISADFDGEKVDPYLFIFRTWKLTRDCAEGKNKDCDQRYCWNDRDHQGWGCKKLGPFHRHIFGAGDFKKSTRFWYNYGEFDIKNDWIIDKNLIYQKLMEYAGIGHLGLCPYFDVEKVKTVVDELPDRIVLDGVNFRPFYLDGKMVNIRHCTGLLEASKHVLMTTSSNLMDICLLNQLSFTDNPGLKIGRN